jgi:hypothetical protein
MTILLSTKIDALAVDSVHLRAPQGQSLWFVNLLEKPLPFSPVAKK